MHPPTSAGHLPAALLSAPAPSTPLGPFEDSAVSWAFWVTLMAFAGLAALMAVVAGAARAAGAQAEAGVRTRLARAAVAAGVLALPAVLTELAHGDSGYDYGAAWGAVFDGTGAGWEAGLQVFGPPVGALLLLPAAVRRPGSARAGAWARRGALGLGVVALGSTEFPDAVPDDWGRESFDTAVWMLHLVGGGIWVGGLVGLLCLALPGAVPPAGRAAFWAPAIRRFSVVAMSCVAAIGLSGLFLYWEHVDGPSQLLTTMYGRVLGVKILLFGGLLLGGFNQFWLHPRIDALRAAGEARPLRTVLVRPSGPPPQAPGGAGSRGRVSGGLRAGRQGRPSPTRAARFRWSRGSRRTGVSAYR
jgi:putative copper export protein